MTGTPSTTPSTMGRPRDSSRDVAILQATLALLTEVGYEQLSMEAVAGRSGTAKTTVYRRYRDKAALVAAAVDHRAPSTPPEPASEDLRENLLALVGWLADQIAEKEIGLLGAVFAGMRSDPRLAQEMRRILNRDGAAMTERPLRVAAERGEPLVPDAAELFVEVASAVILRRVVVANEPCDQSFIEHVVDDVLLPVLRSTKGTPA
ncbi:TetR/AcrR family transcriptional regulator [Catenulispora pinisilvae]|uniref:TetR/AcrR family transcriptional regulator n=1 Tax=Catenulispora pinisilvae TaxID=2705253 RepID=UPI001E390519|nr:TetR/AcrR family transcriptional regulator [Catenulispora pinisilvae]